MAKNKSKVKKEEKNTPQEESEKEIQVEAQVNEEEETEEGAEEEVVEKDELAEYKDKYMRLYSEFDNFRRRTAKQQLETTLNANKELIIKLLPVIDDFERAESSFKGDSKEIQEAKKGVDLIYQKLKRILTDSGLKETECGKGSDFDTELHEAITQIPAEAELKGKIVDVVEKGYSMNDQVIRYSKVVIGS